MSILARILKDRGIVTERQIQEAIQHQVFYGGRLGTSLYELGFITEERLQEALTRAHGVPGVTVDLREIQPDAVSLLPKAVAAKHKVFPYKTRGKTLFLLLVDPGDHAAVARVGYSLGYIVKPAVIPEFRMIQLLRDYYGIDRALALHRHPPSPGFPPEPQDVGHRRRSHRLTFPPDIPTHSSEQIFYFDDQRLLRRLDYTAEVVGGWAHAAHMCEEYRTFDRLMAPTRRWVLPLPFGHKPLPGPTLVQLELHAIRAGFAS